MSDDRKNGENTGRDNRGRFAPGNPGKPKGSRHSLGESFLSTLAKDFAEHGEAAIAETREKDPAAYVRVVAGLLPKEMLLRKAPESELSDDELIEGIELLKSFVARERGKDAGSLH